MALWGNKDSKTVTGTVTLVDGSTTVVGDGTTFTTELAAGQTLVVNDTEWKIGAITDDTHLELHLPWQGSSDSGYVVTANEQPAYVPDADLSKIYGVDSGAPNYEAQLQENRARGIKTPGWNKYVSYTDCNGNVRHKVETLVAMGTIQGDANDNSVVAND